MPVVFKDFSIEVKEAMEEAAIAFLYEASSEVEAAASRESRSDSGQLRGSWNHKVYPSEKKAVVGSPLENAIWEEFGTGEYAVKGKGRKGGWHVPADKLSDKAKSKMQLRVIKGKEFYFTYGKKPNHTLKKAFNKKKNVIKRRAEQIFGELGK